MDARPYRSELSLYNRLLRFLWGLIWLVCFRPSPRPCFRWRRFLLRLFGAKIGRGAKIYNSVRVFYPPNLVGDYAIIGWDVDCYNVDRLIVGDGAIVSQYSILCTATHDYESIEFRLVTQPIQVEKQAWVAAGAFIGPGVTVGCGAVVGARAVVFRDVPPWTVVAGNPAVKVKERRIQNETEQAP